MNVKLSVAIQHHPSRPELPGRLARLLGRRSIETITDPEPDGERNPWRTAQAAWAATPSGCTHRLVLQDDVLPCHDFLRHARNAIGTMPDRIVSFYLGIYPTVTYRDMVIASARCAAWVRGHPSTWVPALALCVPAPLCASLAAFEDGTTVVADDEVYGRWTRSEGLPWYCTIPSLVNHDDDAPSLMRSPDALGARVASCWVGDHDPGLIDWTRD